LLEFSHDFLLENEFFSTLLTMNRIGQHFQQGFDPLAATLTGAQPRADHPFEAANETLGRPAATVTPGQALRHPCPPVAAHTPVGPMDHRGNKTADARALTTPHMHPFRVVARIGIQLPHRRTLRWLPQQFDASILSDEACAPGTLNFTGAFVGMACQDMAGTAHPADFDFFEYRERSYQANPFSALAK
jgi:hypothetical protein